MPLNSMQQLVADEARRQGQDPAEALGLVDVESGFNSEAVSPRGAVGLGQLMPVTGAAYGVPPESRIDPERNIRAALRYYGDMLTAAGGNRDLALRYYNAGITGTQLGRSDPGYVHMVRQRTAAWRQAMAGENQGQGQGQGPSAAEFWGDEPGQTPAPAPSAPSAEEFWREPTATPSTPATPAAPYQGLTSDWWKDFTPEQAQVLRPLIGAHPWLEGLIQHSPDLAREFLYRSLMTAGTTAGVMTGATAGTAIGPVYGTAGGAIAGGAGGAFLSHKFAEELGIAPPGADPRQVFNPGTVAETLGGAVGGIPQAVRAWAYGPGKQAIDAADQLYQSRLAAYEEAMKSGRPSPGGPPTYDIPTLKPGKLSELLKQNIRLTP